MIADGVEKAVRIFCLKKMGKPEKSVKHFLRKRKFYDETGFVSKTNAPCRLEQGDAIAQP